MSAPISIGLFLFLLLGTCFLPSNSLGSESKTIHQHELLPGLQCYLSEDGNLVISHGDAQNTSSVVVLEGSVVPLTRSRRANQQTLRPTFHKMLSQGALNGRRGFSAQADDDADGRIDEDVLDGRDNDGDGRIDEDFAAISDVMVVIDKHDGHQGSHLEFYNWAYPQLQSVVFINATVLNSLDEPTPGWWRFNLPETQWREAEISSTRHGQSGWPEVQDISAFVAEMPRVLDTGSLWLGVVVLDKPAQHLAGKFGQRVRLEKGVLDVPTGEESLPLALCTASSWLQLSRALSEAQAVFAGTTDPMSGLHVPWIVSPGCTPCRTAKAPLVELVPIGQEGLRLNIQVDQSVNVYFDPDMFTVHGIQLGSPESISWNTGVLPFASRVWRQATLPLVCQDPSSFNNPYSSFSGLAGHAAEGILAFEFPTAPTRILAIINGETGVLNGELSIAAAYLDGRQGHLSVENINDISVVESTSVREEVQKVGLSDLASIDQLTLSPDLLDGFPNPFKDDITIRFSIPQTMESAFKVANDGVWPSSWDKGAPVPWESGAPTVSVKIYNINGQELRTLHEGTHLSGEYTVSWNGSDAFGRQIASGTYFCKLQLDRWSVTRRVIFLR